MELLKSSELEQPHIKQYEALLEEANSEEFFYGEPLNYMKERTVLIVDNQVIGCFEHGTSEFEGRSYFRANRPYTKKSWRGNNLMRKALLQWFDGRKPSLAWIDDTNIPSIRMFQGIGFVKGKAFFNKNKDGHFYFLTCS